MRRSAYVLATALALAALSGCASGAAAPAETSPTTPSQGDETPSAAPEADPDDPSTWLITEDGVGPLVLEEPFSDALAVMPEGTTNDAENCAWTAWWNAPDDSYGLYAARDSADADDSSPVTVIDIAAWDDPAAAEGPKTAEGVGLGSSVSDVKAAYPDGVDVVLEGGGIDAVQVGSIFFQYRDGSSVSAVTVTSLPQPPYEVCG